MDGLRPYMRRWVAQHPALYLPIRRRSHPGTVLEAGTDLVIEGFPRCANTWTEALIRTHGPGLKLAHHAHAAAHVIAAVARATPALVLYRDPDAAVRSLLAMYGHICAAQAFADYVAFYRAVLRLDLSGVLLVPFEQATQAPDAVITALIHRFALPLDPSPVDRAAVLRVMQAKEIPLAAARRKTGRGPADAAICAPGNADRLARDAKTDARARLAHPDAQMPRLQAHAVYAQLQRAAP